MFNYIIGKITEKTDVYAVVENNNIGFELNMSTFSLQSLLIGQEAKIFVYYQQKEDAVNLFGFLNREEKDLFLKLISVSGVGPKGAIAILSNISTNDLGVVIAKQDLNTLSKVKGVGKKTAERILVELKDKIDILPMELLGMKEIGVDTQEVDDAIEVLISLGLTKQEAVKNAKQCYKQGDKAEDVIAKALSNRK
ncbi:MAG: Holliday junction branch migration protein RuvA [Clostridia bacterium]|nr:Holliday junction branch migration protein RuvA [Clostridia bacterium]